MIKRIVPEVITNNDSDNLNQTDEILKKKRGLDNDGSIINTKRRKSEDIDVEELLKSLVPFDFIITDPPISYYRIYIRLGEWLEGCINNDFNIEDNRFELSDSDRSKLSTYSPQAIPKWEKLINDLNKPELLKENWRKFTIIDKILSLHGEEQWSHSNVSYISLQSELWWIKTVNQFYSSIEIASGSFIDNHLSHSCFALILELYYRYIWSMYTKEVYKTIELDNIEANSDENKEDEIYDVDALGEMSDVSSSEEEMESDSSEIDNDNESVGSNQKAEDQPIEIENINTIPNVIPVFCNHVGVKLEIDKLESKWFDGEAWDITPVLKYFSKSLTIKYRDMRKDTKLTKKDIFNKICSLYHNNFSAFLNQIGIITEDLTWSIEKDKDVKKYFKSVVKLSFINLTNNGISLSRTYFFLFSNLSLLFSDPRNLTRMIDVSEKAYIKLKEKDSKVTQIENLLSLLEQLNEERSILLKGQDGDNTIDKLDCIPEQVKRNMANKREMRIKQIDHDMELLKEELNKLTGELDKKESRKSKRSLPLSQLLVEEENIKDENISKLNGCNISDTKTNNGTKFSFKNLIEQ